MKVRELRDAIKDMDDETEVIAFSRDHGILWPADKPERLLYNVDSDSVYGFDDLVELKDTTLNGMQVGLVIRVYS